MKLFVAKIYDINQKKCSHLFKASALIIIYKMSKKYDYIHHNFNKLLRFTSFKMN